MPEQADTALHWQKEKRYTAVELVKHNLGILKSKNSSVKAYQGNALKLKRFEDETFDITLLFGPMYHLFGQENKVKALKEVTRITRKGNCSCCLCYERIWCYYICI